MNRPFLNRPEVFLGLIKRCLEIENELLNTDSGKRCARYIVNNLFRVLHKYPWIKPEAFELFYKALESRVLAGQPYGACSIYYGDEVFTIKLSFTHKIT